jgi:hypothetical protein
MRIGISIVAAILIALGIFIFIHTNEKEPQVYTTAPSSYEDPKEAAEVAAGRYYNERYGFSFKLPEGTQSHEKFEGPGAVTITIEDIAEERAFQIFVVPYEEEVITKERLMQDIPSGRYGGEEEITLDGVPARAFVSTDNRLGELREVWLIRKGYLYEITTLIKDEVWLSDTLLTWKFEEI